MWGQAAAEPTALTSALMRQRHAIGGIEAFIGATWSQTADPAFADCVRFRSYCGTPLPIGAWRKPVAWTYYRATTRSWEP